LGEKGGFHYSYVGQVERGEKNISLTNLEKIADALEVAIHQLFIFSMESESFTESEEDIRGILSLLHKLDQDKIQRLHKAIDALYGNE
jgi:transcriptional regulator with XRE-family HTH domain